MADKFVDIDSQGRKRLKSPITTSDGSPSFAFRIISTDSSGFINETLIPASVKGGENFSAVAGENINAGELVYCYLEDSTVKVKKAIATNKNYFAIGFVKDSVNAGQNVTVYTDGYIELTSPLTNYTYLYLSQTTAGAWTTTKPSSGEIQIVGKVVNPYKVAFDMFDDWVEE